MQAKASAEKAKLRPEYHCKLCNEDIFDLERHYTAIHVGTYSPFTYLEMYVSSNERRIAKDELVAEIEKIKKWADTTAKKSDLVIKTATAIKDYGAAAFQQSRKQAFQEMSFHLFEFLEAKKSKEKS